MSVVRSVTLRRWQHEALGAFERHPGPDFLAVACPGAGKTTFALTAARQWLAGRRRPLVIVVPTRHLKFQWAEAAARFGFHLEPEWDPAGGAVPPDMHGLVVTYAQTASAAGSLRRVADDGLVVLDEIHHAGTDRSWGEAVQRAYEKAAARLLLSGTPFRSDESPIPFVRYSLGDHGDAVADYDYDYGRALVDGGVVRPVFFPRFDGHMEWIGADGRHHEAGFDDDIDRDQRSARLRTALSLDGEWLPTVLTRADERLTALRRGDPRAGGLVVALDQDHARGVARLLERRTGRAPAVAVSDEPASSRVIEEFARGDDPWIVAVRMVSEGVDIPRLRVAVYATTTLTPLFFRQVVGRVARWTPGPASQKAYVFVPDDPRLRHLAATVAEQRRHSIARRREVRQEAGGALDDLAREVRVEAQPSLFEALSSVAVVAPDDGLDPDEDLDVAVDELTGLPVELPPPPPLPGREVDARSLVADLRLRHARKRDLRRWNAERVTALARATGLGHREINAELNRRSGVAAVAAADEAGLRRRLVAADEWLESLRR
ncbi:MAG: DEAD/DEAH box helicase [Actinomyces sp.]|nr:MAG: DEAD/DEAH box helicase [Actinomyces sp.]